MLSNDLLRRDVRLLGDMLGEVITDLAGTSSFGLVEEIRQLSRARRAGDPAAEAALRERIAGLSEAEARVVNRAFCIFFDISNLAEDRHRVRVLRYREKQLHPKPLSESIPAAIARLREARLSPTEVQAALDRMSIELVFTAHPSEAKRRSIRAKLRRMRQSLQELDRPDLLPRERKVTEEHIRTELSVLWQTEFLRPNRPTVLDEVERGLSIMPRLWEVTPWVFDALRRALEVHYPWHEFRMPVFLRFGSWMGGDRDGNPNVTAEITEQTLIWQREAAITMHLARCRQAFDFLTLSTRESAEVDPALVRALEEAGSRWSEMAAEVDRVSPLETHRRWVTMISWRLKQSLPEMIEAGPVDGSYRDGREFVADLTVLCESLRSHRAELLVDNEIRKWLDLARVFGLHLARLDLRQDSRRLLEVIAELLAAAGVTPDFVALAEPQRQAMLTKSLSWSEPFAEDKFSALTKETLALFRLLHKTLANYGPDALGAFIISLAQQPSDVLTVLWLWRWAQVDAARTNSGASMLAELNIVPLFEKIDDLQNSPVTLAAMLEQPDYRQHLSRLGDRQIVMVGYSDSTKDGGYLAACWGLYQAQTGLQQAANKAGVEITFFHGRGGSLGRGGGPAARGILSLPPEALNGALRLTEQGEVLAERYDDLQIAYRHLEQVSWAVLLSSTVARQQPKPAWPGIMEKLSRRSLAAYRELVEQPGFIEFFAEATPIDEIENLPIGSRPSRRRGERSLGDLRAIPWVFSWTQNRCLIPAWYGVGTALAEARDADPFLWRTIRDMYREWPFLQATIDNAALALAKTDMYIARRYAELVTDPEVRERIWNSISKERELTRLTLVDLAGGGELLSATPWFQGSVEVRNPYIDPLNLIQIELLRRRRASAGEDENQRLRDLLRLTVQGIAAGMRTTG